YLPRIIPGVGLTSLGIREYKKRKGTPFPYYNLRKKEDWKSIGKISFQVIYFFAAITYKVYIGRYIQQGVSTKEWNPFKQKRAKTEQVQSIQENKLELIMYEEAIKPFEN
ncbi:MAG: hypothetical protein QQN41_08460, partial [Nitrosopumilus sp.]